VRIHTDTLTRENIQQALIAEIEKGRIARHVSFKVLTEGGSRSHRRSFEVQLEAAERDNGRRVGNSGSYGAMRPEHDGYAATYDEWGWLLAALYQIDPAFIVGTVKHPVYDGRDDFDHKTALTYNPEKLINTLRFYGDPYPMVIGRAAKTKRGYMIGRRGADRASHEGYRSYWGGKEQPRTVEEVREFARLEVTA
jgi:hypothetical protein